MPFIKLDFYNREAELVQEVELEALKEQTISKLKTLKASINAADCRVIDNDIRSISVLSAVNIPGDDGHIYQYCMTNLKAAGTTDKMALISRENAIAALKTLKENLNLGLHAYQQTRGILEFKISAIIKFCKEDSIDPGLREILALNLARSLQLQTTEAVFFSFNKRPALFIPFAEISLLKEHATGIWQKQNHIAGVSLDVRKLTGFGLFSKFKASKEIEAESEPEGYYHYSLINPIGEGLIADYYLKDFANAMALFYLCQDADAVGRENQNKGLFNSKEIFIFDQKIQPHDGLPLDSRLCVQPAGMINKMNRHAQGRNRTLLEDSDLELKFNIFMGLSHDMALFYALLKEEMLRIYQEEERSQKESNGYVIQVISDVVDEIRKVLERRVLEIKSIYPECSDEFPTDSLKHLLALEKLFNRPVLYNELGRPYKNPWTKRNYITIKSVSQIQDKSIYKLELSTTLSSDLLEWIQSALPLGFYFEQDYRTLYIPEEIIKKITDNLLFPEYQPAFVEGMEYLSDFGLKQLCINYAVSEKHATYTELLSYLKLIAEHGSEHSTQMQLAMNLLETVNASFHASKTSDKAFIAHCLRKCCYEAYRQTRFLIDEALLSTLDEAFTGAVYLDRLVQFNRVLSQAVDHQLLNAPEFLTYIEHCKIFSDRSQNYKEAQKQSKNLHLEANALLDKWRENILITSCMLDMGYI